VRLAPRPRTADYSRKGGDHRGPFPGCRSYWFLTRGDAMRSPTATSITSEQHRIEHEIYMSTLPLGASLPLRRHALHCRKSRLGSSLAATAAAAAMASSLAMTSTPAAAEPPPCLDILTSQICGPKGPIAPPVDPISGTFPAPSTAPPLVPNSPPPSPPPPNPNTPASEGQPAHDGGAPPNVSACVNPAKCQQ
jgi:hypothetical protein